MIQINCASQEKLEEEWANIDAKIFVPGLLLQKYVEIKTKISLAEIVLDHGAVKNNDFITQYLSNTDLYFLLQVSQTISNSVRKFMKKREQEQKEKEQTLKEHFLYDFNAFIDYARIASLNYLEIEIPEKVLDDFEARGKFYDDPISISINRAFGHLDYNIAQPPKIGIIGLDSARNIHIKEYRLKENEILKFKFHFRQCLKIRESHHVTFFGQTFEFKDLSFTLFRRGGKTFKFDAESRILKIGNCNYIYKNHNNFSFRSNPTVRVKMVEETGVKFKFKFHTSQRNHYTFDRPIYNFDNIFPNFKTYFSSAKHKYNISKKSHFFDMEDHNFEQQQHPSYQISNFGQQQNPFYQSSNFGQQHNPFSQISNFGQQQQFPLITNNNF